MVSLFPVFPEFLLHWEWEWWGLLGEFWSQKVETAVGGLGLPSASSLCSPGAWGCGPDPAHLGLSLSYRYWPSDPHRRPSGVPKGAERTLRAGELPPSLDAHFVFSTALQRPSFLPPPRPPTTMIWLSDLSVACIPAWGELYLWDSFPCSVC
jgi:hypothetical protein